MSDKLRHLFLGVLILFGLGAQAAAPVAPDQCWKESGLKYINDGTFTVFVKTADLSKEELLQRMHSLYRTWGIQKTFPSVSDDLGTLVLTLKAYQLESDETRQAMRRRVNAKVREFMDWPGFSIYCSARAIPHPSTTGSN